MKESIVIQNVLPDHIFESVNDEINESKWQLTNTYSKQGDSHLWWSTDDVTHNHPVFMNASSIVKLKIRKHLKKKLNLVRIIFNGQTCGQLTRFHTDFDTGNFYTFILFSNYEWNLDWGGEFCCYNPTTNKYEYTPYIPNSGVLIPSNWDHVGRSPNNKTQVLRTTVAFSYLDLDHTEEYSPRLSRFFNY